MARAPKRAPAPAATGSTQTGRAAAPRTASRKPREVEIEVIEEKPGFGFEEGLVFVTTFVLIVAFFMLDKVRGAYGEGMFFS